MTEANEDPGEARVLVVEDDAAIREVLVRTVREWDFRVASAWSGEDAVRLHLQEPFDVAILDLNLPRMDGVDTLRQLRRTAPRIQGIMLTAFGGVEAARQAVHLDMVEFLTKPSSRADLERAMDRALRRLAADTIPAGATPPFAPATGPTLEEVERLHILAALRRNAGNRSAAATELGIARKTLYNKLDLYRRQGHPVE